MDGITPPPGLPPAQRGIWDDTATRLQAAALLDRADVNHLRAYVAAVHQHQEATRLIDQTGPMVVTGTPPNQRAIPNPALPTAERAERRVAHLARTLGLTSRAAPGTPMQEAAPMRQPDPRYPGAAWCDLHHRWECVHDSKRSKERCHGPAVEGTNACRMHPGSTGKVKHLAAVALREFPLAVVPVDIHPGEALLEQVRYLTAFLRAVNAEVDHLSREDAVFGVEKVIDGEMGRTTVRSSKLSVWLELQDKTRRSLIAASAAALQANADERLVRMAEAQGAKVYGTYQRGLERITPALSDAQWESARQEMPAVLRELVA